MRPLVTSHAQNAAMPPLPRPAAPRPAALPAAPRPAARGSPRGTDDRRHCTTGGTAGAVADGTTAGTVVTDGTTARRAADYRAANRCAPDHGGAGHSAPHPDDHGHRHAHPPSHHPPVPTARTCRRTPVRRPAARMRKATAVRTATAVRMAAALGRGTAVQMATARSMAAPARHGPCGPCDHDSPPGHHACDQVSARTAGGPVRDRPVASAAGTAARLSSLHRHVCLCQSARCGVTPRCREVKLR